MSQPDSDTEVVELSVSLSGLTITVRGSPARAAEFAVADQGSPTSHHHDQTLDLSQVSQPSAAPSSIDSRSSIAASFPLCPAHWLARGNRLTGSRIPGNQRATRAWTAGCWARAVVENRISSPNRTEAIELQNRFWCVVSCQSIDCPRVFTSSRAFFAAVGVVEGSTTICHAFPSETEARIYLEAAGQVFPDTLN